MAEITTRYGQLTVPNIRSDLIGRFLQHYGEWAWDEVSFVASMLPDNASVLDVGAFLGTFGLGVSLHRPLRSLCFVEASPLNARMLERNVRRNAQVPAVVIEALVTGSGYSRPAFGHADPENLGSTSYAPGSTGELLVEPPLVLLTVSKIREEHGPFDLVKLDAEGMELEILRCDAEFLASGETTIWTECNEAPSSIELADLLLSWGLDLHYFAFPSHNPDNARRQTEALLPLAYEAGLLAAPRSAPVLSDTLRRHGCILQPIWNSADLREMLWRTPRWGLPEWQGASAEQVAALAGHALRDDDRRSFLMPGWQPGRMLWEQVGGLKRVLQAERQQAAETAATLQAEVDRLHEEEARERERQAVLDAEVRAAAESWRRKMERDLAKAATLALDRLAEIGVMREERDILRERLHEAAGSVDRLQTDVGRLVALEADRLRHLEKEGVRLREVELETARLAGIESRLRDLETLHEEQARQLNAILQSATWRLARPIQRFIAASPPVHRLLRLGRRAGGKAVRLIGHGRGSQEI